MDERKIIAAKAEQDEIVPEFKDLKKLKIKKLRNRNDKSFDNFNMEYQNIDNLEENEFGKIVPKKKELVPGFTTSIDSKVAADIYQKKLSIL